MLVYHLHIMQETFSLVGSKRTASSLVHDWTRKMYIKFCLILQVSIEDILRTLFETFVEIQDCSGQRVKTLGP